MSDDNIGGGGGAAAGDLGGGADTGGGAAAPDWLAGLPDELKGDAGLARYGSIEELARGHIETRKVAASRIILPGEGASDADWAPVFNAIGRPESADKYELPDGVDATVAEGFKPFAHKLGLTAKQAKAVAEFDLERTASAKTAWETASKADLDAFKAATPEYDAKLVQTKAMLKAAGVDPGKIEEIETKLGTSDMMKLFFNLAAKTGEHGRVDGDDDQLAGAGDPDKALDAKMKDATWRERAKLPGTPERQEYDRLVGAAAAKKAPKTA